MKLKYYLRGVGIGIIFATLVMTVSSFVHKNNITDEYIISCIDFLQDQNGYSVIGKDNNTIYFQIWSNVDSGRGFSYSVDSKEPVLPFLTKLEKLQENNWYYYEEDYNEWRLRSK